jgi:hypothetical protein
MTSNDFKIVAESRIGDADALLAARRWSAAYYLLGYAAECAFKACAAKQFQQHQLPDKTFVNKFYTHEFETLLSISGLRIPFEEDLEVDANLHQNWSLLKSWDVEVRYNHSKTEAEARDLHQAITHPTNGVLTWLKKHW